MQGCNLRCNYCHNRDSWSTNPNTLKTTENIISEILKYNPYYESSKGGVTVSGGEPLLQSKFLITLFKELKKLNIHTALDTSGSIPLNDDIKELLEYTDLVILDIKHIDNEKCISLTSQSNKNTLILAKYLNENNVPCWIRQVLIPGITDNNDDLNKLKEFIDTLSNVEKIEVIPYHNYGEYKWNNYKVEYPFRDIPIPTNEDILKAKKILGV